MESTMEYHIIGQIIISLSTLVLILFIVFLLRDFFHFSDLPPGPYGLPIVGYLPFINQAAPHRMLGALADKYGNIYSLKLGSVLTIVLSSPDVIRKLLGMKETAGRAPLYLTHGIMEGYGIIGSDGEVWQEHRKFLLGFMRETGMRTNCNKASMEQKIHLSADNFAKELYDRKNEPTDVLPLLIENLGNSLNQLIFGFQYQKDDPTWKWLLKLLQEGIKFVAVVGPMNFLPWLRYFPPFNSALKYIKENQVKTHEEYQKIIDSKDEKDTEESIVSAYLAEMKLRKQSTFSLRQLHHLAADVFGAGTETTVTTMIWILLDLSIHQETQDRVRGEILSVTENRPVATNDLPNLPLLQAAIMETQRLRNIVPLGIPHGISQDIEIDGYKLPKGSMVLLLLHHVHLSPKYWKDPQTYNPERFLDEQKNILRPTAFLPFQAGRRSCPGDEFVRLVLVIFLSAILSKFKMAVVTADQRDPTSDPVSGLTLSPRPFKLMFHPI